MGAAMATGHANLEDDLKAIQAKMKAATSEGLDEGLTGEQRLLKMTRKPASDGLTAFAKLAADPHSKKAGMDVEMLANVIQDDEYQLTACLALPWTLIFFCLFMLLFQQHYTTSYVYLDETNLRTFFASGAEEVNDINGIYSWLKSTYLPYLYSTDQTLNHGWTAPLNGGDFQQQIGAFKVRAHYSQTEVCDDEIIKDYNFECNSMWTVSNAGKQDTQVLGGTNLAGWGLTSRRLQEQRRLQPNQREYPERSADPSNWLAAFLGHVSRWFPSQATYVRAGRRKKDPEDAGAGESGHPKPAPSAIQAEKGKKSISQHQRTTSSEVQIAAKRKDGSHGKA
jgi:hypothetical protein